MHVKIAVQVISVLGMEVIREEERKRLCMASLLCPYFMLQRVVR